MHAYSIINRIRQIFHASWRRLPRYTWALFDDAVKVRTRTHHITEREIQVAIECKERGSADGCQVTVALDVVGAMLAIEMLWAHQSTARQYLLEAVVV